jgi:hypothetical protein
MRRKNFYVKPLKGEIRNRKETHEATEGNKQAEGTGPPCERWVETPPSDGWAESLILAFPRAHGAAN